MNPDTILHLTAQRLARLKTGHLPLGCPDERKTVCSCPECTVRTQILRADKPLRRAIEFIHYKASRRSHSKEAREVLSDLAHGPGAPALAQIKPNGEKSGNPFSTPINPVACSSVGTSTTTLEE